MNLKTKKKNFFTLSRKANSGFTLVELIVVIAILAVLAGVGVPAYSGYVKKANMAADEQLLADINKAFASACIMNGESNYGRTDGSSIKIDADGTVAVDALNTANDKIDTSFATFFEGGAFKTFAAAFYKADLGMFVGVVLDSEYAALYESLMELHGEDIAALLASSFGQVGITELAGKVDVAAEWVASMVENPNFHALLYDVSNFNSIAKALGFNSTTDDGFGDAFDALREQKIAQLAADPANAGKDEETLWEMANNQILANSAVLTAASNASSVSSSFMTALGNGTAKDTILANVNNADGDPAAAVSQAAMAYGMYAAYLTYTGEEIPENVNLADVYSVLDDPGFQAYVNQDNGVQAQTDLEGYLAAMDMISTSSGNNDAAYDVLLNGFSNDQLLAVLQGLTGTN